MASEYKGLYNEYSLASAAGLEIASLTVTNELNITGANLTGLGVDNSTIQFTANQLSVKTNGITNANINDVSVSKVSGGTASASSIFNIGGIQLGASGYIQGNTASFENFSATNFSATNLTATNNIVGPNITGGTANLIRISGTTAYIAFNSGNTGLFNYIQGTTCNFTSYLNLPGGSTGNPFNQNLNTTDGVIFNTVNALGYTGGAMTLDFYVRTADLYASNLFGTNNQTLQLYVQGATSYYLDLNGMTGAIIRSNLPHQLNKGCTGTTAFFNNCTATTLASTTSTITTANITTINNGATITTPIITSPTINGTITTSGSDLNMNANGSIIKTKRLAINCQAVNERLVEFSTEDNTAFSNYILKLPNYNATVATIAGTETLTSKTLTNPSYTAGTIAVPAMTLITGSYLTTPTAGAVEYDGTNILYSNATGRGLVPHVMMSYVASDFTLGNVNTAQACFTSSKDGITLAASTAYEMDFLYIINSGTTTHTTAIGFTHSGAITAINYTVLTWNAAANTTTTTQNTIHIQALTSTVLNATSINAYTIIQGKGMLINSTSGLFTPQLTFSAAPGGTNLMKVGSYFKLTTLGPSATSSWGPWT